jgi:transcription initiation factor TFIIF subunit beta
MSTAPIKNDPGSVKLEDDVKLEPGLSPSDVKNEMYEDDELYEDAGDLDVGEGVRAVWLVKLPAFLAERWKDIDEDEEIVLGTVKVDQNSPDQRNVRAHPTSGVFGRREVIRDLEADTTFSSSCF